MKYTIIFLFILCLSTIASADTFEPSHYCSSPSKPYKPYTFTDQYQVDRYNNDIQSFNDDVQAFKRCINDFVEEQNDEAKNHQDAAEDAIDDWNRFVNYELN